MDFPQYTHCASVRCLDPQDYARDERTQFIEHVEAYMYINYPGSDYNFVEISQERDGEGIYFSETFWTETPLDEEDGDAIRAWSEVIVAHLNINCDEIEQFP